MSQEKERVARAIATLKRAAAILRDAGVPFAVAGGLAEWARGAPLRDGDVDLVVTAEDLPRAVAVLRDAGMEHEEPPEEWLTKVKDGGTTVALMTRPGGIEVTPELLGPAEQLEVEAVAMPVLPLEDVLVSQLLALGERDLAYAGLLEAARAVREQVDWDVVRTRTAHAPFARAFFTMVEGLCIVEPAGAPHPNGP